MEYFIGVDIDDTIADYVGGIERRYGPAKSYVPPNLPEMFPWVNMDLHFGVVLHNAFLRDLDPMPGAAEALNLLRKSWPIRYITSRPAPARGVTKEWLWLNHFPNGRMVFLATRQAKIQYLAGVGECMIAYVDDLPQFLGAAAVQDGRIVIAYARPWNVMAHVPRADHWRDIPLTIAKARCAA